MAKALYRKRSAHSHLLLVFVGLIEERFGVRMIGDGGVNLLARHPFLMSGLLAIDFSVTCGTRL